MEKQITAALKQAARRIYTRSDTTITQKAQTQF
jgi:hypothetical protein